MVICWLSLPLPKSRRCPGPETWAAATSFGGAPPFAASFIASPRVSGIGAIALQRRDRNEKLFVVKIGNYQSSPPFMRGQLAGLDGAI